jgi:hypothetical protein
MDPVGLTAELGGDGGASCGASLVATTSGADRAGEEREHAVAVMPFHGPSVPARAADQSDGIMFHEVR